MKVKNNKIVNKNKFQTYLVATLIAALIFSNISLVIKYNLLTKYIDKEILPTNINNTNKIVELERNEQLILNHLIIADSLIELINKNNYISGHNVVIDTLIKQLDKQRVIIETIDSFRLAMKMEGVIATHKKSIDSQDSLYNLIYHQIEEQFSQKLDEQCRSYFPRLTWPPPGASSTIIIPSNFIKNTKGSGFTLYDASKRIVSALDSCGYNEKSFLDVPSGFAIVTRLEQISIDGSPKEGQNRWEPKISPISLHPFDIFKYTKALFTANPGFFRIIVFIVTPLPFIQTKTEISIDEAKSWLLGGLDKLPSTIGNIEYNDNYKCTVLIYEFEKTQSTTEANLLRPGRLEARVHLEKSNIWYYLRR